MTTYTLSGIAVYTDPSSSSDNAVGVDNSNVTLELVVPETTTSLSYFVNPAQPGDEPGDETVDIAVDDYTVRINGMTVGDGTAIDPEISIFEVTWVDGGGSHTSTVLVPFVDEIDVSGLGIVDADYIFVLAGAPLPTINTPAEWDSLNASIIAIGVPTGTYGPNTTIPLTSLGGTVSEDDVIVGTGAAEVFKGGAGADDIEGRGGNDKIFGEAGKDNLDGSAGKDKLFGGGGKDKLFGANGNDTLNGGKGNDILKGEADNDTLNGGAGNDKMIGGAGKDTFIFSKGDDVITDFNAVNNKEKIDLSGVSSITGFKDLKNHHTSQAGSDLVIDDDSGNTLTLNGLTIGDLDKGDFIF